MSCVGGLCREEVYTGSWLLQECGKYTLAGRPGEKRLLKDFVTMGKSFLRYSTSSLCTNQLYAGLRGDALEVKYK